MQYYDISANNTLDDDQYTQIMRNHGPPPAYEIAVTMKSPMEMGKCHLCQSKVRMNCLCDSRTTSKGDETKHEDDWLRKPNDQFLNVKNISQHHIKPHKCTSKSPTECNGNDTCDQCNAEWKNNNDDLCDEDVLNGNRRVDGFCECTNNCTQNCRICGKDIHLTNNESDVNDNVPSTSGDIRGDINSNFDESDEAESDGEGEFDSLNENGLIRVDMKKLIDDQTGLPTYEAALKLESSGYV